MHQPYRSDLRSAKASTSTVTIINITPHYWQTNQDWSEEVIKPTVWSQSSLWQQKPRQYSSNHDLLQPVSVFSQNLREHFKPNTFAPLVCVSYLSEVVFYHTKSKLDITQPVYLGVIELVSEFILTHYALFTYYKTWEKIQYLHT